MNTTLSTQYRVKEIRIKKKKKIPGQMMREISGSQH